ncbi:hypothetical protein C0995_002411 [Termitomyces sp. Mi166|nr:hypothetical protein C0995_002411 [Termitomyces sp. Mi166\
MVHTHDLALRRLTDSVVFFVAFSYDISKELKAANATGGCIYDADNVKRVKYAFDHGHQVASHTWSHKDLTKLTWDQIHDEMWRVELALRRITGATPAFMRPPYGNYNDLVLDASGIRGQSIVIWDFECAIIKNVSEPCAEPNTSSGDSAGHSVTQQKNDYNALANRHPSTILALNHETYETTA